MTSRFVRLPRTNQATVSPPTVPEHDPRDLKETFFRYRDAVWGLLRRLGVVESQVDDSKNLFAG